MRSDFSLLRMAQKMAPGLVAVGLAALLSAPALAATVSGAVAVSATVEQSCNLDVRPLRFDTLRSDGPRGDADSSLGVACTPETAFVVSMDNGQNQAAGRRRMADASGGGFLAYELYSDAARTRRWGASLADAVSGQATGGRVVTLPIYARISESRATAGAYSDVVTVTVSF